jgi:hypothetical protein
MALKAMPFITSFSQTSVPVFSSVYFSAPFKDRLPLFQKSPGPLRPQSSNIETWHNWLMPAPALKALSPAPGMMTTRNRSSSSPSCKAASISSKVSWLRALRTSGRLMVRIPISSLFSQRMF